jgi:hypothetical protein
VLEYLRGIVYYAMRYVGDNELMLDGFIDHNWVGDVGGRKSTSRFCFSLGSTMVF